MRQIYIKVLVKNTGEKTRQYWEDKIYGTGSPKIDRLVYVRKTGSNDKFKFKLKKRVAVGTGKALNHIELLETGNAVKIKKF